MSENAETCCTPADFCCCRVESIVSMDERGQMVLPKEIREKAKIRAGDKMAVVSWEKEEKIFCISLIKVEDLETMVRSFLGPVAEDIIKTKRRGYDDEEFKIEGTG